MNYAGLWQRFVGLLIDVMITMPFVWLVFKSGISTNLTWSALPYILLQGIYYVSFWLAKSATPGMMVMKLRIVTDKGPLTLWQALLRYAGLCLSSFLWGLGGLWMLWDKRRQTLQDKMARTFVVKAS